MNKSYMVSTVNYTDPDKKERTRIVLDVPKEQRESFLENWKKWNEKFNFKSNINLNPSYDDIHEACKHLASRIKCSDFTPDYIVGLARGGLPLAVILSHMLDNTKVISVNYSSTKGKGDNKNHSNELPTILGKRLLIVDDLTDSSITMKEVSDFYKSYGHEVKTLVFHYKKHNVPLIIPDYYWVEISEDSPWITYPWENNS